MTRDEYRAVLEELGLSQLEAGRCLGVTDRTAQNWAARRCPEPIARILKFFIKWGLDLRELPHV